MKHKVVRLEVAPRNPDTGKTPGITVECSCGWVSGGHFSSSGAQALWMDHEEEEAKKND